MPPLTPNESKPLNAPAVAPCRITFCITDLEPGGAERCLVELVTRLDRQRFDPTVYCLGPRPEGNALSLVDTLERSGVGVRCFGARRTIDFPRVVLSLRRHFAAERPQIVQAFLFHANVAATLAARLSGVPHIVTGIRVGEPHRRWRLTLSRTIDRWVERHVCVSRAVRDFSLRQAGLPQGKLVVIPNGVDVDRFAGATPSSLESLGVRRDRRIITYIGRLDEQKGLPWLIDLMPRILAHLSGHDLLLVGSGPQRELLERLVAERGLSERVHFAGFRADVPGILAASDLLVLPSRWEGMPNVILEAMASGKAVVATDVEGVAEALGGGAGQQTVPSGDAEGFVHKVLTNVADARLRALLGAQNQARARDVFSLPAMVDAYQRLYQSLAG
jgi:glycosyltransferase involved in cell wall biosynthesis